MNVWVNPSYLSRGSWTKVTNPVLYGLYEDETGKTMQGVAFILCQSCARSVGGEECWYSLSESGVVHAKCRPGVEA